MNIDKSSLKRLVEQSRPNEILVLSIDSLDKNQFKTYHNEIDKFMKKNEDYLVMVIKR